MKDNIINRALLTLPYRDYAGCMIGKKWYFCTSMTFPLAQLKINPGCIEFTVCWLKHYKFYPGDIQRLEYFHFFGKQIQIVHKKEGYPPFMTFSSFNNNIFFWRELFNQAGFNIPEH